MLTSKSESTIEGEQASIEEAKNAISNYTRIVERRLKPSLDAASALRDKVFTEIAELKQMSSALDILKLSQAENESKHREEVDESGSPLPKLETRVNIGQEFYVRANVYNLDHVIVDVGLGIMVEMTPHEARVFIQERLSVLEEQAKNHTSHISEIQAHLKSITDCLAELKITSGTSELLNSAHVTDA